MFTSLGTGAIRALFPGEGGSLVAGETVVRPDPPAFRLDFGSEGTLTLHDFRTGAEWTSRSGPKKWSSGAREAPSSGADPARETMALSAS